MTACMCIFKAYTFINMRFLPGVLTVRSASSQGKPKFQNLTQQNQFAAQHKNDRMS